MNSTSRLSGPGRGPVVAALLGLGATPLVDSFTAWSLGWRPEGAFESTGLALSVAAPVLLCCLLMSAGLRRRAPSVLLLLTACVLGAALLELGAHGINERLEVRRNFHTRGPNIAALIPADPGLLPGISGPARFTTARLGLRAAAEPASRAQPRWLAVGGSTTECVYLDDEKTWPWRLSQLLRESLGKDAPWIGNAGISGFDTRQHLRLLEEGTLLRGVEGVIIQPGINDLWRFAANEEEMAVRGRFGDGLKIRMPRLELEPQPVEAYRPLWARSRTVALLRTLRALRDPYRAAAPEGEGGREYVTRRKARAEAAVVEESPDWEQGASEYAERLRRLIGAARARGLKLVFVSQPVLWGDDMPREAVERCWLGWRQDWKYWGLDSLAEGMARYNAALKEVCDEEDIPLVNTDSMNGNLSWFYDDCHYTEAGAEALARLAAPVMIAALE
ncbi:MAG: hypothetical protein RLZZ303_3350 [Candidatus Hydrogenedentota bacterium]